MKSNFTCLNSRMTREYRHMSRLCTSMSPGEAKGNLDAKAFLPYCYRIGSLAGAAFVIPVKHSASLKAKTEAEIFVLSVPVCKESR